VQLKADGIGCEGAARQPGPFDRALAFFDPLLRLAALIVEGNDALGPPCQVGDEEPDPRIKLAGVPLDIGHDTPRLFPALRLIAEAGVVAAHLVRGRPTGHLSRYPILSCKTRLAGSRIVYPMSSPSRNSYISGLAKAASPRK